MASIDGKFHFAIDRGGTFTDVVCQLPSGEEVVSKLLSEDPQHYADAPTEGIRRALEDYDKESGIDYSRGRPVCTSNIGSIRMGSKLNFVVSWITEFLKSYSHTISIFVFCSDCGDKCIT